MNKTRLKEINIERYDIYCHPKAGNAYTYACNCKNQFDLNHFSDEWIKTFQAIEPLHAVETQNKHSTEEKRKKSLQIFSGWHWFEQCQIRNLPEASVIVHSEISDRDIELYSWLYLLSLNANSWHRATSLVELYNLIEQLPLSLRRKILRPKTPKSAMSIIYKLTQESRSAVRHQLEKTTPSKPQNLDILNQLLKGGL